MSDAAATLPAMERARTRRSGPAYFLRILGVTAMAEFKLKYSGSALGYIWSFAKPLTLFTVLYFVFGHIFKLNKVSTHYPQSLLIGIVCFYFFADATTLGMYSLVSRESLLRKLVFPRIVIPASAVLTAAMTFAINLLVVVAFVVWARITPQVSWLLILPLLVELLLFIVGISLILSTLFIRLRDISQLWELVAQLFMYASPIMYPIGYLPPAFQRVVFINPFTQIIQDLRDLILGPKGNLTVTHALGTYGRLVPVGVTFLIFFGGLWLFRREEPWFAERA